ncbi:MAG: glycosyltransferase [Paludibacter sp.]|nr:glycosyltransferase [Paludibacter sp.]
MSILTAIILTYNEEIHIARCINSLKNIANEVIVVDSYSTDKTIEIAENLGTKVLQNKFVNQAVQFNWALENCPISTDWIRN